MAGERDRTGGRARQGGEDGFEERGHVAELAEADDGVPEGFEAFPAGGVEEVLGLVLERAVAERGAGDGAPGVEIPIGAPVASLELFSREAGGAVDDVTGVVEVPVAV